MKKSLVFFYINTIILNIICMEIHKEFQKPNLDLPYK